MENVIEQVKAYTQELKDERDEYKADYQRLLKTAEEIAEKNERLEALLEGNDGMSVKEIRSQFVDLHRRYLKLQTENEHLKSST